jgi:pyruvate,water dikinase
MGFDHLQISLCVGVQKMVRADLAGAGVIFTRDQQSGFPEFMSISMGWGLGETVVQGLINPDTFVVYKPFVHHSHCLPFLEKRLGHKQKKSIYSESGQGSILVHTDRKERISYVLQDEEVLHLCRSALIIEKHFQKPMDIEWAKDGETDQLFVLQARPISSEKHQEKKPITMYRIKGKPRRLLTGISIGEGIASGKICLLNSVDDIKEIGNCPLLVSEMANTSWLPIMQQRGAKGLITDFGGTNSHAAILSRELGIPAILGTVQATYTLHQAQEVTIVALEGDFGHVYEGQVAYDTKTFLPEDLPTIHSKICLDLESAQGALRWWRLPCAGVGLVNLDFILKQFIRIHPLALLHSDDIQERSTRLKIDALTKGYPDPIVYFQTIISSSLATIAATHYPLPVVVRLNSLTSQEFAQLRGGKLFETGTLRDCRGTSRYLHEKYKQAFLMELETIVQVRQRQCLDNLQIMVPYCQTPHQANALFDLMQKNNISPKEQGLQVHLSCDCQENLLQGKALRKHFSHVSLNVSQFLEMVHEMGKYPEKEQILYQLVQTWTDTGGEVALRAHKAEDLKFLLDSALQAGIARFTVPPEEVALLQEMLAQTEKK